MARRAGGGAGARAAPGRPLTAHCSPLTMATSSGRVTNSGQIVRSYSYGPCFSTTRAARHPPGHGPSGGWDTSGGWFGSLRAQPVPVAEGFLNDGEQVASNGPGPEWVEILVHPLELL